MLAKQGGAAIGRAAGRAVDNTAAAVAQGLTGRVPGTNVASSVPGALLQQVAEAFGLDYSGPPKQLPQKLQQPVPSRAPPRHMRLRKQRGDL